MMGTYHVGWSASGVETVTAASPERALEVVEERLGDHLWGLTVDDVNLEPRERAA